MVVVVTGFIPLSSLSLVLTMAWWESRWKEYCAEYWLKELQESMDRCTGRCDITEIMLKMAFKTIQSINPFLLKLIPCFPMLSVNNYPITIQCLILTHKGCIAVEEIVRKGEIACIKQFLLFSQCFLPYMILIFHFKCTLKCCLQFVSIWTSLKFCRLVMGYKLTTSVLYSLILSSICLL